MVKKTVVVKNKTGLHARPASEFVKNALKFKSNITICRTTEENREVNAKSIILLLSLGLCNGEEIEIVANGEDEKEAVDSLIKLIESGFGE
ncbi:HPr family phosphocarrier protein [Clostridium sp. AL.422]|uniref:HPr family phosphocarrier protein n=1 Tax=Clostridium TaxID=1485 RepID=UPI00293DDE1C|nr:MULTISPECIES: HPr family phosphocarrier protein [unclassified Clostridium]MDV4149946.1 HPr family phosphocarrier protein [Clostridium sp. AL.422]